MTEPTHAELDRIASSLCSICRHSDSDPDAENCPCNDCRPLCDLANLVESLEARIPPKEGEAVYCVCCDCDNCPYPDGIAYTKCGDCRLFIAAAEPFVKKDHLDDFCEGRVFRDKASAQAKAASWRGDSP